METNSPVPQTPSSIPIFRRIVRAIFSRRMLCALLILAALVTVFYQVENWRGKRAWEAVKSELEAKGEVLDWWAYVPKPVPDDQNLMKAPMMQQWFVKGSSASTGRKRADIIPPGQLNNWNNAPTDSWSKDKELRKLSEQRYGAGPFPVAEVVVLLPDSNFTPAPGDTVLQYEGLATQNRLSNLLPNLPGSRRLEGSQGKILMDKPPNQVPLARIYLKADKMPTPKEVTDVWNKNATFSLKLRTESASATNASRFLAEPTWASYAAADYLEVTEPAVADFNLIREAAKRPYVRMDSDFKEPFAMPIPNFVAARTVAQVAGQRAQCSLLLGRPDRALHELSLINNLRRIMESKPVTLVSAMINVALVGLEVTVIEQGFQLGAWQEPQLAALQEQIRSINLLPGYVEAFRGGERAGGVTCWSRWPNLS